METRWAVEFSPSAALTYKYKCFSHSSKVVVDEACRSNHPDTEVYNQCSNVLLQDAINERDGKKSARPLDLHTGLALPSMPKCNEVDIIYGGSLFSCNVDLENYSHKLRSALSIFLWCQSSQGESSDSKKKHNLNGYTES